MKRLFSVFHAIIMLVTCMACLTACKTRDGTLDDVSAALMNDHELNSIFSSITVDVYNGKSFTARIFFKDTTSDMLREISPEDGCDLAKLVHDKMKEAILEAGYTKISMIGAMMYSSDWKYDDKHYILDFGVGAANKTHVQVFAEVSNPIWDEVVSWGGFGEVG